MAVAKRIVDSEPSRLDWLRIEDEDGKIWKYVRGNGVDLDAPADVEWKGDPTTAVRAVLKCGKDGNAVLRQDGPGLPRKMIVDYVSTGPRSHLPTDSFWAGKIEYLQE